MGKRRHAEDVSEGKKKKKEQMNVAEEEWAPKRSKKRNDGLMLTDKREKREKEHPLHKSRPVWLPCFSSILFFFYSTHFMVMGPSDRQHIT